MHTAHRLPGKPTAEDAEVSGKGISLRRTSAGIGKSGDAALASPTSAELHNRIRPGLPRPRGNRSLYMFFTTEYY
jgi:hypothetical protein